MKNFSLIVSMILALFLVGCSDENTNKSIEIIDTYMENREVWEETESLETSFGFYTPGFSFFDIDLDGEKELAVQYSGGTMRNCTTKFYKFNDNKIEEVYATNPELNISLAVGNFKKYVDMQGKEFYLNTITYKTDVNVYNTYIDELVIENDVPDLINRFAYIETYEDSENSNIAYYVGNTEVTKEEYDRAMNEYLKVLVQEDVTFEFITYEDWKSYTEEQKKVALLKAFNA